LTNAKVIRLVGEKRLESITVAFVDDRKEQELPVSGLFVSIGYEPANQFLSNVVKLDEQGFIIAGEDTKTGTPGIFAAGDTRSKKLRQLTTAASDGAVAAVAACEYLR
jgi:thioredoxin reductase (NADPH)